MFDHLRPGVRIKAIGPAGRFSLMQAPAPKYLFISAGSGITPMMSMVTYLYDSGRRPDILFINCARRPSEILFRDRLELMAARRPGIELRWIVDEPEQDRPWTGFRGVFNPLMLSLTATDHPQRTVFCCGPEPFMAAVRAALETLGHDMARYHQESFGGPPQAGARAADVAPQDAPSAKVTFAASGKTAKCAPEQTILAAARAAGVPLPSGCGIGLCGTCIVQKLGGAVRMAHQGGITEEDIEAGYILARCAHPIGDVTIDL